MSAPSPSVSSHRSETVVLLASVLAIVIIWAKTLEFASRHWLALYDDAYIFLRYVDNLFSGCGLRFNCTDVPVEGFTSPLYLGLLAVGRLFSPNLEAVTSTLGTLCVGATGTLAVLSLSRSPLAHPHRGSAALSILGIAVLLATSSFWLLNSVIGLEAPLGALLAVLILRAALLERHTSLRVWVVVGVLCRPEFVLFLIALPVFREGRNLRYFLYPVACLLGFLVTRVWIFDEFLPLTYFAKSGGTSRHAVLGLHYIGETVSDFPMTLLAPLALLEPRVRRPITYFLLVASVWCGFFLRSGGDTFYYSRLFVPLMVGLEVLAVYGLFLAATRLSLHHSGIVKVLALVPLLPIGGAVGYAMKNQSIPPTHVFANVARYKAVGEYLKRHHGGATVATVPIGAIGYFSHLRIIDLVGLTAPAIAHAGTTVPEGMLDRNWIGHERHNTPWVLEQAPDLIVTTKFRRRPWQGLADTSAGFIADWLLLRAIKAGEAPYEVLSAEVEPGLFCLMFQRRAQGSMVP